MPFSSYWLIAFRTVRSQVFVRYLWVELASRFANRHANPVNLVHTVLEHISAERAAGVAWLAVGAASRPTCAKASEVLSRIVRERARSAVRGASRDVLRMSVDHRRARSLCALASGRSARGRPKTPRSISPRN